MRIKEFFIYFFGQGDQIEFTNFSLAHFLPILTMVAVIFLIRHYRVQLRDYKKEANLRYLLAFALLGLARLFAKPFGKHRLVGYGVGAVAVCLLRFLCSFLSGAFLWDSYCPEGMNVWVYSLLYNGGYMIPNAILTGVCAVLLCRALDPLTLRPMKRVG